MHKLQDASQPDAEIYKNRYVHTENGVVYDIKVFTPGDGKRHLEVQHFDHESESNVAVDISETREALWLDMITVCDMSKHGHFPNEGEVNFKMALKVLHANDTTPEALQAKIDALEQENARNRALLKEKLQ